MSVSHDELVRLAKAEPVATGAPDLGEIRHAGRRLRVRRRIMTGLAALAVVAAIGIPAALFSLSQPTADGIGPGSSGRDAPDEKAVCGVVSCIGPGSQGREMGKVIGEVLAMGTFEGGETEVLYAARVPGFDLRTSEEAEVDVLMAGIDDGTLRRTVWALQPGTEPRDFPVRVYGGLKHADEDGAGHHYGIIGYAAGEHDVVEVTLPDGSTRPVTGTSTEVLPGWTAFYDTGAWPDEWTGSRAELTYSVPGGASCSVERCGSAG
ncbi:hypothetical protein [Nocardioides sp.]|uniref:hypothetical protein n=1 Tax=Nocardioides sp. TaxID=35761 RepID=UPI002CABE6ED|nr:hypothetical protein [Nocardioides sp.]HXH79973.1 hypothetical protein [Nocardioides sp.]